MVYLKTFIFPGAEREEGEMNIVFDSKRRGATYYQNTYPFRVLSEVGLCRCEFSPLTIFYGGNGSGKSTALNVISNKLHINRAGVYNTSECYDAYVRLCSFETDMRWTGEEFDLSGQRSGRHDIAEISHVITSDDVFKTMLKQRADREQILFKSRMLMEQAYGVKMSKWLDDPQMTRFTRQMNLETGECVNEYVQASRMRSMSLSAYVRDRLGEEERGFSNGETSLAYITEAMKEEGLYLLDEPENSLSPRYQMALAKMIAHMVENNNIQVIMATHSPFLLSIPGAKIYDLDAAPATVHRFEELESMQLYYGFFTMMSSRFE